MYNPLELLFSSLALGIGVFSSHFFATKVRQSAFYIPLLLLLLALTLLSLGGVIFNLFAQYSLIYIALLAPCFLTLAPSLWLYSNALVANKPWSFKPKHLIHYIPALLSLSLSFAILIVPSGTLHSMFFTDETVVNSPLVVFISVAIMAVIAFWFLQTVLYAYRLVKLCAQYHFMLKQVFCDIHSKQLRWLLVIASVFIVNWLWAVLALVLDELPIPLLEAQWGQCLILFTTWWLSYFGMKQQPGFITTYQEIQALEPAPSQNVQSNQTPSYQRSALSNVHAQNIAQKIHHALVDEQLYLEPDLTLYKLAKHLGEPSQYVSQTLSQTLQTSFFECISKARVEAAKVKLLTENNTVLEIAMSVGFNTRSSFYKAFKTLTGMTPSQYQKTHVN